MADRKKRRAGSRALSKPGASAGKQPPTSADISGTLSVSHVQREFSGPLPPPEVLAKYEEVLAGAADRIIAMAETQSKHRQAMEAEAMGSQVSDQPAARREARWGQICGLTIGVCAIGASLAAALAGYQTFASIFGGTTVVGLVSVFIYGRSRRTQIERPPEDSA